MKSLRNPKLYQRILKTLKKSIESEKDDNKILDAILEDIEDFNTEAQVDSEKIPPTKQEVLRKNKKLHEFLSKRASKKQSFKG